MTLVKNVATAIPDLMLGVVAIAGMVLLIGLSAWDLPVEDND